MLALIFICYLAALTGFSIVFNVTQVGKLRAPLTPGIAAGATVLGVAHLAGLAYVASQL